MQSQQSELEQRKVIFGVAGVAIALVSLIGFRAIGAATKPAAPQKVVETEEERLWKSQFSAWDGSHKVFSRTVKELCNDPGSFEHVRTGYRIRKIKGRECYDVMMTYRAKNAFGGVITKTARAAFDVHTGTPIKGTIDI